MDSITVKVPTRAGRERPRWPLGPVPDKAIKPNKLLVRDHRSERCRPRCYSQRAKRRGKCNLFPILLNSFSLASSFSCSPCFEWHVHWRSRWWWKLLFPDGLLCAFGTCTSLCSRIPPPVTAVSLTAVFCRFIVTISFTYLERSLRTKKEKRNEVSIFSTSVLWCALLAASMLYMIVITLRCIFSHTLRGAASYRSWSIPMEPVKKKNKKWREAANKTQHHRQYDRVTTRVRAKKAKRIHLAIAHWFMAFFLTPFLPETFARPPSMASACYTSYPMPSFIGVRYGTMVLFGYCFRVRYDVNRHRPNGKCCGSALTPPWSVRSCKHVTKV